VQVSSLEVLRSSFFFSGLSFFSFCRFFGLVRVCWIFSVGGCLFVMYPAVCCVCMYVLVRGWGRSRFWLSRGSVSLVCKCSVQFQ